MIGDTQLTLDENSNVNVRDSSYEGTDVLWELLTKFNCDRSLVTPHDLRSYTRILESTSVQLNNNDRSEYIQTFEDQGIGTSYRN